MVPLTGTHYVLNAMAACAVAHSLGVDFPAWQAGLQALGQIHRRCQVKGETRGITVLDDYGHHPTEIASTLRVWPRPSPSADWWWPFSRTATAAPRPCCRSSSRSLPGGLVFVTEIYAASEAPVPGISGRAICDGIRAERPPGGALR